MFKWEGNNLELMIEVGTEAEDSTRDRGVLLEKLGKEILQVLQYEVIEEIRITGMEVDLLAKNKETNEEILVECKAHSSNLSADVITKLVGNVYTRDVSAGWLMTTCLWQDKPTYNCSAKVHNSASSLGQKKKPLRAS